MTLLSRLLRGGLDLVLVSLFGLSAVLLVAGVALPQVGHQMIIIDGGSMSPAITTGSAVFIDTRATAFQAGDVVTIRVPSSGVVFTHRITSVDGTGASAILHTQGDANQDPDATASPASWVVGRVQASVPNLGYVAAALQSGTGRAGLISLLLIVLALRWFGEDASESQPAGGRRSRGGSVSAALTDRKAV